MINKYSNLITVAVINNVEYIHYNNCLVAFNNNVKKCYYIEPKDMKKKTVMEYIQNTYRYKYSNYTIEECFCITNLLPNN